MRIDDIRTQRSQYRSTYYYGQARPAARTASQSRQTSAAPAPYTTPTHTAQPTYARSAQKRRRSPAGGIIVTILVLACAGVAFQVFRPAQAKEKASQKPANNTPSQSATLAASNGTAKPTEQDTPPAPAAPAVETITRDAMTAAINGVIAKYPGLDVSATIIDLTDQTTTHYGTSAAFTAASTGKLITAAAFLSRVESGAATLTQPIGGKAASEQLKTMIVDSDNAAWEALNLHVTYAALGTYAQSIGIPDYNVNKNTITTASLAKLLVDLKGGKLLNQEHTQLLLGHMKNANRTDYILEALPKEGLTVYHKAGWLDVRSNDAAIIDNGTRPYVLVIFTKNRAAGDEPTRKAIIHQITAATVEHFIGKQTAPTTNSPSASAAPAP